VGAVRIFHRWRPPIVAAGAPARRSARPRLRPRPASAAARGQTTKLLQPPNDYKHWLDNQAPTVGARMRRRREVAAP